MKLYGIDYQPGTNRRDDVLVLDETKPLLPQALGCLNDGYEEPVFGPDDIESIYELAAFDPSGREYSISLTVVQQ